MDKAKHIKGYKIALSLSRNILPVAILHSLSHRPALGCFDTVHPVLIISSTNQKQRVSMKGYAGKQLFTASQNEDNLHNSKRKSSNRRFCVK